MAVCFNCAAQDSKRRNDPPHDDLELVDRHATASGEVFTYRCRDCGAEVEHLDAGNVSDRYTWEVHEATSPSGP
jgi:hypothetical protein